METVRFYRGQEDEVVVEKSDFEQSIFREQYVLALQQIDKMLNAPKEKIPSILAFCGDRGEGKSSCMESVRNMLLKKEEENIATFMGDNYPSIKDATFHILETIDPAFFDKHHNVLEFVLGQMFTMFKAEIAKLSAEDKKRKRDDINSLQEKFHKAKWCLTQMEKDLQSSYDPIEELDSLAAGMSLQKEMDTLISEYLKYFKGNGQQQENKQFLVVTIDDLDLNVSEAYVMAEQIRKYLVSKQCLLLVSLKVEQLIEVIANYLNKQSAPNKSLDSPAMAAKYVTKLIPMEKRINMPKIYDLCDMQLSVYKSRDDRDPKIYNSIKEAVVQLIYMKTRFLFYNSKGGVSPIVPNNLRSLRHLLGLLFSMENFNCNDESISNKHAFKAYFYQTWIRTLSEDNQRKAQLLTSGSDISDANKLVVSILSEKINTDKMAADSLVAQIVNANNYSYNISVGDVFYLINFLERSNVDEELKHLLFFIKSYYGIRLYEYYDVITEQDGEMNPEPKTIGEVFRSDGWFKRTNQLQRFVNGSYFTYQPDDLLPKTSVNKSDFYRDLRVYSANTLFYKDNVHSLKNDMRRFEQMNEEVKTSFKRRFRVAEMLALCTKKSVKQKEPGMYYSVHRDFSEPYYLTNYHIKTGYLVFDIMAPFYNLVNLKYTYGRFEYLADENEEADFYNFAYHHDWSLLRRMIDYVRVKEYNEDEYNQQKISIDNLQPIADDQLGGCFKRLISNGSIRNGDVLLAMMENVTSRRANMHGVRDHVACIKDFYRDIINSEMRTYRNARDAAPYIIRFAFLEALIELLSNPEEGELFNSIYSVGLEKLNLTIEEVYQRFPQFFNSFKGSKKNTSIIADMHRLYSNEASRLTDEQWMKLFPDDKQYKKENIAKILNEVMTDLVGADLREEETED